MRRQARRTSRASVRWARPRRQVRAGDDVTRPAIDWERVEYQFRAGILSLREIAESNGCSHVAVTKRAKAKGWDRDLSAKIKAKAEALVNSVAVTRELTGRGPLTEQQVVAANAHDLAGVSLRHRTDLRDLRDAAIAMLAELRGAGEHVDTLDQIAQMLGDPEADENRLRQALNKAISLPSRVGSIKAIAETITKLIDAERTAWNLDDAPEDTGRGKTLSDAERASRLATIMERARRAATPAPAESRAVH